jgi:hypothetical protein
VWMGESKGAERRTDRENGEAGKGWQHQQPKKWKELGRISMS